MSVRFDQANGPQSLEAVYPLPPAPGAIRLAGVPVSITLWIYLEAADVPTGSDRATIWWFGEGGQAANNLRLEAVEGTSSGFNLEATLQGSATIGPVLKEDVATDEWHCVSVVLKAQGQTVVHLALYADADNTPDTTTGSNAGVDLTLWDTFSLARNRSGGASNLGKFFFEQVAIWNGALGAYDTASMFTQRIPPADGQRLTINMAPDFSYWFCVGHSRSGIVVRTRDQVITPTNYWQRGYGDLFNESTPPDAPVAESWPFLVVPDSFSGALWNSLSPLMRYDDVQPITPIAGRIVYPPSRLQPHFFFYNSVLVNEDPDLAKGEERVLPEDERAMGFYHDPNLSKFAGSDYRNTSYSAVPISEDDRVAYVPFLDLAQCAKRLADWVEFMGLTAGRGTGADNRYAGCVEVRGIGLGGLVPKRTNVRGLSALEEFVRTPMGATMPETYSGWDDEIPLEQHPRDWVLDAATPQVRAPWATWFRTGGVALVREYMACFWEAYKWELDERGLCYPLRVHFDYEGWPRDYEQLSIKEGVQIGVWPDAAADAKAGTELLLNYTDSTLNDLVTDASISWEATKGMYDPENNEFQQWWNGLSVVLRLQALSQSVFADMATHFPETKWGNYRAYVADDPAFKYVEGNATYREMTGEPSVERWFNTPDNPNLVVPGDFSTPVLYTNGNLLDNLQGDYGGRIGYSYPEVVRDYHRMRLDAVFNARNPKPVAPTIENAGRPITAEDNDDGANDEGAEVIYVITDEDLRHLMAYAWQRGADEFIMFTYNPSLAIMRRGVANCAWLRDWVHTIPQARQDRVGRVSRLGRRGM